VGDFENFDFFQNGGHFDTDFWSFFPFFTKNLTKNDRHFEKNQNFQNPPLSSLDTNIFFH